MGFRQEAAALKVQLPHATKHVLQVLAFHACELCGRAWPGVPLLALETGLDQRSVRRALDELRKHPEWLTVYRYPRGGRGVTTEYIVLAELAKLSTAECSRCENRMDTLTQRQGLTKARRLNPDRTASKTLTPASYQPSLQPQPSARAHASVPTRPGPSGPEVEPSNPPGPLSEPPLPTPPSVPSEAGPYIAAVLTRLQRQRGRTRQP